MEFYVAYAIRHFVSSADIEENLKFSDFETAMSQAEQMCFDDDDSGVFTKYNGDWYRVIEEVPGGYLAHREKDGWGTKRIVLRG